jgi:hypothetical protein
MLRCSAIWIRLRYMASCSASVGLASTSSRFAGCHRPRAAAVTDGGGLPTGARACDAQARQHRAAAQTPVGFAVALMIGPEAGHAMSQLMAGRRRPYIRWIACG